MTDAAVDRGGRALPAMARPLSSVASACPLPLRDSVAEHIKTAFTKPGDTKPEMAAKKAPDQTAGEPLYRLVDKTRKDENRKEAVKQCRRYWGANYSWGGTRECDEYPFATTYEGAARSRPTTLTPRSSTSP